jgi:hypothetical protein
MKKIESHLNEDKKNVTVFLQADKIDNYDIFKTPDSLITYLNIKYNFPNTYIYLFIDEFQHIKEA